MANVKHWMSSLFLGVSVFVSLAPAQAQVVDQWGEDYYGEEEVYVERRPRSRVYYTVEDVRVCRNQGRNTARGAVVGGVLGAGLGALLGNNDRDSAIVGGLVGAVTGGILGNGLSCKDEERYVMRVDRHLSRRDYNRTYEDRHSRVIVLRSGYSRYREVCRTYHTEFVTPNGWRARTETACYVNGQWRHGYDSSVIYQENYYNPAPPIHVRPEVEPYYDESQSSGRSEEFRRNSRSNRVRQ